ncbi:MAG TPA: nucleotidyl transferase AbiEii/AbiGii toxin family protein [Myxococcaceae bacterium]|nr:nucleotidyl transferase AbiEii/AbiGii toxin family protein [Myxococcaceae bacterium]
MSSADSHEGPVTAALRAADEFFMGRSRVHRTAEKLFALLREEKIEFALAGALAVNVHGVRRMTEDVDVLITREGLERFKEGWLGRGYVEIHPGGKTIRDAETRVKIDFLLAGDYPGDRRPKPIQFPNPSIAAVWMAGVPVVSLRSLIELKVASGMTAKDRPRDLDDVIRLIRAGSLPRDFGNQLNPYVRSKFDELWEAAQIPPDDY